MGGNDFETGIGRLFLAHDDSENGTVIFGEKELITCLSGHFIVYFLLLETVSGQDFLNCVHSKEIARTVIQELEQ